MRRIPPRSPVFRRGTASAASDGPQEASDSAGKPPHRPPFVNHRRPESSANPEALPAFLRQERISDDDRQPSDWSARIRGPQAALPRHWDSEGYSSLPGGPSRSALRRRNHTPRCGRVPTRHRSLQGPPPARPSRQHGMRFRSHTWTSAARRSNFLSHSFRPGAGTRKTSGSPASAGDFWLDGPVRVSLPLQATCRSCWRK